MKEFTPTELQKKVINHHNGHARVLAIAGSGKTTTMVQRISNLINNHKVEPKRIRVLMFNSFASEDFKEKLKKFIPGVKPYVNTFHSFSYQFIQKAIQDGIIPRYTFWIDDESYDVNKTLHSVIDNLAKSNELAKDKIDPDEALMSISLWKGSLITPINAGHYANMDYVKIYRDFEDERNEKNALTYDDFVPFVVRLLENDKQLLSYWSDRIEHLIIDEYQDVNYSQQRLIELLAGKMANVMVVGDDDQTIYEWRGARPDFILKEFETTFTSKPHHIFKLDQTFRFGPLLAQCAENSIRLNTTRQIKKVFANNVFNPTSIDLFFSTESVQDTNDILAKEVIKLVKDDKVEPSQIRVISRLYSQLSGLEQWFLTRMIPYKVLDSIPFFKRREVKIILDYLYLLENYHQLLDKKIVKCLLSILNTPNRKINKAGFEHQLNQNKGEILSDILFKLSQSDNRLDDFCALLEDGNAVYEAEKKGEKRISEVAFWLYKNSLLQNHYLNFFGEGEQAANKISATENFILYIGGLKKYSPIELIRHINSLDSTFGAPENKLIVMSTVYKTKGLEFDYVFIPNCLEGNMPYISSNKISIYDKTSNSKTFQLSESLENERRLFYVAITRAKKRVVIGGNVNLNTSDTDQSSKKSRFIEEIMLAQTNEVLFPIVHNCVRETEWLDAIRRNGGYKSLMNNLKVYLTNIGNKDLRIKVDDISMELEEEVFSYKENYPIKKIGFVEEEMSEDPWDNVK